MGRSMKEVLQLIKKLTGYEDMFITMDAGERVKFVGFELGLYSELKDEEEEAIKERLRQLGYYDR